MRWTDIVCDTFVRSTKVPIVNVCKLLKVKYFNRLGKMYELSMKRMLLFIQDNVPSAGNRFLWRLCCVRDANHIGNVKRIVYDYFLVKMPLRCFCRCCLRHDAREYHHLDKFKGLARNVSIYCGGPYNIF